MVALLGVILTLPGLGLGWQTDDHLHRASLTDEFPVMADARRPFWDMFAFVKEGTLAESGVIERGELPWWTPPNFEIAFYRPVAGITHWIDYKLWPHSPWIMHAHSIVWYGLTVFLAALLFRRFSITPIVAGLAALVYAISDGNGLPAVWLANRNATLAACFGICTILAYDWWRRDGSNLGAIIAPIALLTAVLANEGAVAAGAYLLAYALFIDPDRTWKRFAALLPCTAIGVAWWLAYRANGYGAVGSGVYIDPAHDTLTFLFAFIRRAPVLIYGMFASPPSDAHIMMSEKAYRIFWIASLCLIVVGIFQLLPHLRTNNRIRFALTGMLLSIVPPCATFASDRLLMFAGLGAAMIIAQLIVSAWKPDLNFPKVRFSRFVGAALIVFNLIFAPFGLVTAAHNTRSFGDTSEVAGLSLPHDDKLANQRMMVVSTPSGFLFSFAKIYAATQNRTVARKTLTLGSGVYEVHVGRPDDRSLLVTQAGGWLMHPGQWPTDDPNEFKWVGTQYLFQTFDVLFRDQQPFTIGQRIELSDCALEIVGLTPDARPATVRFEFDNPLEDESYRWIYWKDNGFAEFDLPAVGESVTLPAPRPTL
ncbi:MAG: hypothetical protein DHS20C16_01260 [Phycisphaerae bacterium]|nr:MAG: hypothetical protein DHS20C16_01260 [Phycisphaerae bacterium]